MKRYFKVLKKDIDEQKQFEFVKINDRGIKNNCKIVIKFPNGDIRLKAVKIQYDLLKKKRIVANPFYFIKFHGCKQKVFLFDLHRQGAKFAWLKDISNDDISKPMFSEVEKKLPKKKIIDKLTCGEFNKKNSETLAAEAVNLSDLLSRVESCLPTNPYPESIFPMTEEEYKIAIPSPQLRTAIGGCVGRSVFEAAKKSLIEALKDEFEC